MLLAALCREIKKKTCLISRNDIALTSVRRWSTRPTVTNDMTGIWHENQWPVGCRPTTDTISFRLLSSSVVTADRKRQLLCILPCILLSFLSSKDFRDLRIPNFARNIILRGRKCARGKKNGEDRRGEEGERGLWDLWGKRYANGANSAPLWCHHARLPAGMRESFWN